MIPSEAIWAEISLRAIRHNFRQAAKLAGPQTRILAVVKADGYGHGAVEVSRAVIKEGAGALGVARINEAAVLRRAGIDSPILIFGYTPPEQAAMLHELDLTQTVFSCEYASRLDQAAQKAGCTIAGPPQGGLRHGTDRLSSSGKSRSQLHGRYDGEAGPAEPAPIRRHIYPFRFQRPGRPRECTPPARRFQINPARTSTMQGFLFPVSTPPTARPS